MHLDKEELENMPQGTDVFSLSDQVPTEEELENAKIMAGNIFLKKSSGLIPPIAFTVREYTTAI